MSKLEYHNIFAREQLLSAAKEIQLKMENVKRHKEDDNFDEEFKDGARKAYSDAIEVIYKHVEQLASERGDVNGKSHQ